MDARNTVSGWNGNFKGLTSRPACTASSWAMTRLPSCGSGGEKRREVEPEDLSGNLIVQLGLGAEDLNRRECRTYRGCQQDSNTFRQSGVDVAIEGSKRVAH